MIFVLVFGLMKFGKLTVGACAHLLLTGVVGLVLSSPATAATFSFSFVNTSNGGGVVKGLIFGLEDDGFKQIASQVEVTENSAGFGVGTYGNGTKGDVLSTFTTIGGEITRAYFFGEGGYNTLPDVVDASLGLDYKKGGFSSVGLSPQNNLLGYLDDKPGGGNLSYGDKSLTFRRVPDASVPEPSLLLGLLGLSIATIGQRRLSSSTDT